MMTNCVSVGKGVNVDETIDFRIDTAKGAKKKEEEFMDRSAQNKFHHHKFDISLMPHTMQFDTFHWILFSF